MLKDPKIAYTLIIGFSIILAFFVSATLSGRGSFGADTGIGLTGGCNSRGDHSLAKAFSPYEFGVHEVNLCPGDYVVFKSYKIPRIRHEPRRSEPLAAIYTESAYCNKININAYRSKNDAVMCTSQHQNGVWWFRITAFDGYQEEKKWPGGLRLSVRTVGPDG